MLAVQSLDVWATVVAVAYLQTRFSAQKDEWRLIETKARQWLDFQDLEGHNIDTLLQKAKDLINAN